MTPLLLAALAAACPAIPSPAAPPPAFLAQARAAVASLERGGPAGALAAEAGALAEAVGDPSAPAGEVRARAARFASRLARHCELAALPPAAPASPADGARLREILARPEYRGARGAALDPARWLQGAWDRLLELLGSAEAGQYAAGGRNVFFAALAAAILAAVLFTLRRRASARRRPAVAPAAAPAGQLPDPAESDARAAEALAIGDAAETVRQAFLALLADLERAGLVPPGRALTNREMAARLGGTPFASGFPDLALTFDRVVYGRTVLAAGEAGEVLDRSRALRRLRGEGSP